MRIFAMLKLNLDKVFPYLVFGLFVLASKWIVISLFGNATPYWDQWDGEADALYRPWLEGSLRFADLFTPHNEHRIVITRILALALLELNHRVWDPLLQMQVNAVIHSLSLLALLFFVSPLLAEHKKKYLFTLTAVVAAVPFGWENTLAGFQSQFYFLLLFSFIFLWGITSCQLFSKKWWLSYCFGLLSLFSLASGVLALIAGAVALGIKAVHQKISLDKIATAMLLLLLTAAIGIITTPVIAGHAHLKAQSLMQFFGSMLSLLAWPAHTWYWSLLLTIFPIIGYVFYFFKIKSSIHSVDYFFIAILLWMGAQITSIAYGRSLGFGASRYQDVLFIGLICAFTALLSIKTEKHKKSISILITLWLAALLFFIYTNTPTLIYELNTKKINSLQQEKNLRAYICNHDINALLGKPDQHIPYPETARLAALVDNPYILNILPGNIYKNNSKEKTGPDGEAFCPDFILQKPYTISTWQGNIEKITVTQREVSRNSWYGSDYFKSKFENLTVIGSFKNSETETGVVTLHLKKGDRLLYRSGPREAGQRLLIDERQTARYATELPKSLEWSVLEFNEKNLPETFDITFVDSGTQWGEWSAIAVQTR